MSGISLSGRRYAVSRLLSTQGALPKPLSAFQVAHRRLQRGEQLTRGQQTPENKCILLDGRTDTNEMSFSASRCLESASKVVRIFTKDRSYAPRRRNKFTKFRGTAPSTPAALSVSSGESSSRKNPRGDVARFLSRVH